MVETKPVFIGKGNRDVLHRTDLAKKQHTTGLHNSADKVSDVPGNKESNGLYMITQKNIKIVHETQSDSQIGKLTVKAGFGNK